MCKLRQFTQTYYCKIIKHNITQASLQESFLKQNAYHADSFPLRIFLSLRGTSIIPLKQNQEDPTNKVQERALYLISKLNVFSFSSVLSVHRFCPQARRSWTLPICSLMTRQRVRSRTRSGCDTALTQFRCGRNLVVKPHDFTLYGGSIFGFRYGCQSNRE